MPAPHPGAQSVTTWITQDSPATTVAKPALIQTNLDKSAQIRSTTTDQDIPNPTTSNHPEIHETQCFLRSDARFFSTDPAEKFSTNHPASRSGRTEPNRPEQRRPSQIFQHRPTSTTQTPRSPAKHGIFSTAPQEKNFRSTTNRPPRPPLARTATLRRTRRLGSERERTQPNRPERPGPTKTFQHQPNSTTRIARSPAKHGVFLYAP